MTNLYRREQSALFKPKNLKTLRPEFVALIGKKLTVKYGYTMDHHDPYPGRIAYVICNPDDEFGIDCQGVWIPEEDLVFDNPPHKSSNGVHE